MAFARALYRRALFRDRRRVPRNRLMVRRRSRRALPSTKLAIEIVALPPSGFSLRIFRRPAEDQRQARRRCSARPRRRKTKGPRFIHGVLTASARSQRIGSRSTTPSPTTCSSIFGRRRSMRCTVIRARLLLHLSAAGAAADRRSRRRGGVSDATLVGGRADQHRHRYGCQWHDRPLIRPSLAIPAQAGMTEGWIARFKQALSQWLRYQCRLPQKRDSALLQPVSNNVELLAAIDPG